MNNLIDAPAAPSLPLSALFPASRYAGPAVLPAGLLWEYHKGGGPYRQCANPTCRRAIKGVCGRVVAGGRVVCWGCWAKGQKTNG